MVPLLRRIHPDDIKIIEDTDEEYYANKINSHQREYRIRHKDGEYRWILDRGMVISYTEDNKPKRIIGTHTDITQRKRSEEENKRMAVVASANENGIVFTDREGKIFWCNEGFTKLTGYTQQESLGQTPLELCRGPLSSRELLRKMVTAFNSGRNFNLELVHYRKDTSWFWGRVQGQAIIDEEGEVTQYFAMIGLVLLGVFHLFMLARGKPNEAKQLAALADCMRRRAEEERRAGEKAEEDEMLSVAEREEMVMNLFAQVAYLAGCMLHEPVTAPAAVETELAALARPAPVETAAPSPRTVPGRSQTLEQARVLAQRIAECLAGTFQVQLTVHDNRSTMISFRRVAPLLKVRVDFNPELQASVDAL